MLANKCFVCGVPVESHLSIATTRGFNLVLEFCKAHECALIFGLGGLTLALRDLFIDEKPGETKAERLERIDRFFSQPTIGDLFPKGFLR